MLNGRGLYVGQIAYPALQPIDHAIGAVLKDVVRRRIDIGALQFQVVLFNIAEEFSDLIVTGRDHYIRHVRTDPRHQVFPIQLEGFQMVSELFPCDGLIGVFEFMTHGSEEGGIFGKLGAAVPVQLAVEAPLQLAALPESRER